MIIKSPLMSDWGRHMKLAKFFPIATLLCAGIAINACAQTPSSGGASELGPRNVVHNDAFKLTVNWCEVKPDRSAECELTAISLTQDYKAGFAYPIMQDQTGAQYRMVPSDGSLGQYTMIAGEPYTIKYMNQEILPTSVERVRGLVGSWAYSKLNNIRAGGFQLTFSDIPARPDQTKTPPASEPGGQESTPQWETVGFWTYDQQDGMRVPEGLVLKNHPGAMAEHNWTHRLELKTHAQLPERADRILWPVYLNRADKLVCVNAPYPSYTGYIDMLEDGDDGVYAFASCKGGAKD